MSDSIVKKSGIQEPPEPVRMPILVLRGLVLFPQMVLHFDVGREKSLLALNKVMSGDRRIFLVAQKDIRDDDLLYLVGATTGEKITKRIKLKYLQILTGTLIPTATVILKIGGNERTATCTGNGPVDAAVKAIKTLINETVQITEFLIQAMNKGSDDVGRVHVQVRCGQMLVHGFSANTDVVKAAEAFVDALNLLNATEKAE